MAARGRGLDCIVIGKVMWQGFRLHSYCQSNVAARGRGLDYIGIAKVGPTVAARGVTTLLLPKYCGTKGQGFRLHNMVPGT